MKDDIFDDLPEYVSDVEICRQLSISVADWQALRRDGHAPPAAVCLPSAQDALTSRTDYRRWFNGLPTEGGTSR